MDQTQATILEHLLPAYAVAAPSIESVMPRADSAVGDVFRALAAARLATEANIFGPMEIQALAAYQFESVRAFSANGLGNLFVATIGINPVTDGSWLAEERDKFVISNADLIKTLPERHFAEVRHEVTEAFTHGYRVEDLAERLQVIYEGEGTETGKAIANAERLARDQTLSLHAELNEIRQKDLGIEEYIWRTMGDNRVRGRHDNRNGKRFRYDTPPEGGHPGTAIQCRCYAEPVIPGVND